MNSMTGYGRANGDIAGTGFSIQINSVNRKGLDLKIVLPPAWDEMEPVIAEAVKKVALRGTVHVRVELDGAGGTAGAADFDESAAGAWLDRLANFAARRGGVFAPDAETLAQVALQFRRKAEPPAPDGAQPAVLGTLERALAGFSAMRATEGKALREDFQMRLVLLRTLIEEIAERAPAVVTAAREALLKRLREAGLGLDAGDERVLKEIALFADRCDIAEELTRFRSHLAQLEKLLGGGGEIGRKAEFILQEMGREVNTTGAKANDYEIARRVIELKNELERIKEQLANVE